MNRPNAYVRWAGSKTGVSVLALVGLVLSAGVLDGDLPWWAALGALVAFSNAVNCPAQMRAYDDWVAQWRMMATGSDTAPEAPGKKPRRKRNAALDVLVGVALLVGVPWLGSQAADTAGEKQFLAVLWLVDVGYLVFLAVRGILRRRKARSAAKSTAAEQPEKDAPVAWVMSCAAESPSRDEAMMELPEYSARLMERNSDAA
jgi:hypothetical protein